MIYITGDTHGVQRKWTEQIESVLKKNDTIIVTGDFGYGFYGTRFWSEDQFFDDLAKEDYRILFLDGNHENFDKLDKLPVSDWCGGKVHVVRKNIIHLMRGNIYNIEGSSIFVMGGGYSIDKDWRTPGVDCFVSEMYFEKM